MPNIITTPQTTTKSFQSQRLQNPKLMIYKVLEYFKFYIFKYNGLLNLCMHQCEGHGLWAGKCSAMTLMPTPDLSWFSHSNTPCDIGLKSKLNRHLTGQGTEMLLLLQVPLRKLAGVTLICREVLHPWRARRIALMDVLETIGQWLSLTNWWASAGLVTDSTRSSKVTEARAVPQSQAFLQVDIHPEAREAVSLGHGSVSLEPIHNLPIFHSIGWQFCAISTHCLGASSPEFQLTVLGVVH